MGIQVTDLHLLRDQLVVRRQKLETAVARTQTANLLQLLEQVDRALERVDHGSYGVCDVCQGSVEPERLFADPLTQLCLDCHKDTRADRRTGRGLHGRDPDASKLDCTHCHTDHAGRSADIVLLDPETFDHARTNFPLRDAHAAVPCSGCHVQPAKYREAPTG